MTFMLLAGSSSAWAWTVYFDNSQTKWSNVYVVLGHDTYHRGDYKMTKVSNSDEIYYLTREDWGDAKYITFSNSVIASGGTNKGFKTVITSGYDTFNNGASSLNHLFYSKVDNTISKNNDLYPRLVINCGLIGFYVGEYQDWNQSQFYVHSNGSGHISSYNTFNDGTTAKYGIIYAESKNYNVTHSTSWGGPTMGENAILGKRYLITGDNSVSISAGTELSCTFNIDETIKAGETSTASVTSSGKSKYGTKNYAVDSYYIKKSGETTLNKLEISGDELQTQSLEVGTYTVYALVYDGKIYAKGGEQTLTVETACTSIDNFTLTFENGEVLGLANNTQANLSTDAEVNWSSNNANIASVDNSGIVTGQKWGTTTITATTTGNDEYCANQTASASITIKEFPSISISGTTPFCGETTELTASIDNISNDNNEYTISWYKKGDANVKETGVTFNASEGTYYAKITGDYVETATSNEFTVIKKSTPTAADFEYTAPNELEYNSETKTATVNWNSTQGGAIIIAYSSSNSTVTHIDPINVGTYYVFVSTVEDENFCAVNNLYLGTFTITCPAPAEVPTYSVTQATTSCKDIDNEIGIITLTNYNDAYTYKLNGNAVTVTDNKITGLEAGDYTVSAIKTCGSAQSTPTSGTSVAIEARDLTPTISKPIEISGKNSICAGGTTELTCNVEASKGEIYSYSWDQSGTKNGNKLITDVLITSTNYIATVTIKNEGCSKDFSNVQAYQVTVNPVPSFTTEPSDVTLCSSSTDISVAELIAETKATASNSATIKLYNGNGDEITSPININTQTTTTTTYELKASTQTCSSDFVSFTLTVNPLPDAPSLTSPEPVCAGTTVNLPTENLKWYNAQTGGNVVSNTAITATGTYWAAAVENGCESATRARYDVTVNPLPNITGISVNNSTPVINEDVLLTIEGGDIKTVEWSITPENNASLSDASGNSVKLTSTASGAVTVTATAISSNGCRATSTKEVTFSAAENCEPITDNTKIEIWCKVTGTTTPYCHAYNIKNSGNKEFIVWPGLTHTSKSGDYYIWTLDKTNGLDISNNKVGIVFSKNSYGNNQTADITTFYVGNRYYFTYNANSNDKNTNYTKGNSEPLTTYPPLSAPAVKTVSATSEEGSGIVTFTGKIVKTGCAAKSSIYYGYQFKKADEEWPTTGIEASNTPAVGKLIPLTNASATALNYQFSANVEGLDDGDYHFRAYIINGYNFTNGNYDQGVYYGLDKLVTVSTVKVPVGLAKIELTALDGTPVEEGHKYCIGSTAYIKVTSDVKYTTATWKSDLGVEIVPTRTTNIYQFIVKGNDEIVVLLSNRYNVEPVSSEPISVEVYASASVPEIALEKSSICNTDEVGTTLTVTRTKSGQYYALYKEDGNGGTLVEDYRLCSTDDAQIVYTGLKDAAKYFVKTYTTECPSAISGTSSTTLTVVDSKDVNISIEPITTENTPIETTPWMPVKLKVTATSDYTVTSSPEDAVINISGNTVKVKLPLPEGANNVGTTDNNVNVTFDNVPYRIIAELKTAGEEGNPCAQPAIANITLTQYIEICD